MFAGVRVSRECTQNFIVNLPGMDAGLGKLACGHIPCSCQQKTPKTTQLTTETLHRPPVESEKLAHTVVDVLGSGMVYDKQHPKGNGLGRSEKEESPFESMFKWPGDVMAANRRNNTPLQSRLRSPRGSPYTGNSPRRRLFTTDVSRFYARNSHWVLITILSTVFMLHWSLQNARISGREPLDVSLPSSPSTSQTKASAATATQIDPSARRAEVIREEMSYSKSKDSRNHVGSIPDTSSQNNNILNVDHPVIPRSVYKPSSDGVAKPLRTILVGRKEGPLSGPAESSQHYFPADLLFDGLDRSHYIKIIQWIEYDVVKQEISHIHKYHTNPPNEPLLIIVDWASLSRDCHALERIFNELKNHTLNLSERKNVYLLYMDLSGSSKTVVCPALLEQQQHVVAKDRIRIAKRGLVKDRHWNHDRGWVETGHLLDLKAEGTNVSGGPILHLPYFVREAFVDQLISQTATKSVETLDELPSKKRKTDIAHFWRKRDYSHYGFLRRHVSSRIISFGESVNQKEEDRKLRWLVRTLGEGDDLEIHRVSEEYVSALLSTKIVVVAQKDEWEDHYRLMEALASGALVMSDVMLASPQGLLNQTNILFYDSSASLYSLLKYYTDPTHKKERLAIARKGFEFAMGRHRSWHRMESILFGEPLTLVDEIVSVAPERKHPPKHAVTMMTATIL